MESAVHDLSPCLTLRLLALTDTRFSLRRAVAESVALVAGLHDVAMVVSRSSMALVLFASPNTLGHSVIGRLVVRTTLVRSSDRPRAKRA